MRATSVSDVGPHNRYYWHDRADEAKCKLYSAGSEDLQAVNGSLLEHYQRMAAVYGGVQDMP